MSVSLVGTTATHTETYRETDVRQFAGLSGDDNPIHVDEDAAKESRFGRRVCHGMLTASTISAALAKLPGEVVLIGQDVSYLAPVYLGETVTAEVEIVEDYDGENYGVDTTVTNEDGETVIGGGAVVLIGGDT